MSELELLPLESEINNALIKENITEAKIKKMYEDYGGLKLKDLNDREGYILISESRKNVKAIRIIAEKACKKGREHATEIRNAWIAKEKELVAAIKPLEDELSEQEEIFEAEQNRQKEAKLRKQQENLFNRQMQLTKMGAQPIDGNLVLEDASVDMLLIKDADDEIYEKDILPMFQVIFDRNEATRIESERIAEEKRLQEAADRKKFEEAQAELKKQQEEFEKKQQQFRLEEEAAEELRIQKAKEERAEKFNKRMLELVDVSHNGFNVFSIHSELGGVVLPSVEDVYILPEKEFNEIRDRYNSLVQDYKKEIEKARLADIEKQKQEAAAKAVEEERQRIAAQKKKDEEEAERKRVEEQERLDKANDSQKWVFFADSLNELKFPTMKSKKYREWVATAKDMIDSIKAFK